MEKSSQFSFGEMLREYRKRLGLTQQQLARKLAMHQNTVGAWERGDYLPATRGMILEIAHYLRLDEIEIHHLLDAGLTTIAARWNIPHQRNPFFVGRKEILQQIHSSLTIEQNITYTRSYALSGLTGIGKTQTAIEYAYQHAMDYSAIFWISAETEESITSSFVAIATTLKLPVHHLQAQEQVIAILHGWLMNHHNWLLIFDKVEHVELVKRFLPASREGSLLFTTLKPTLGPLAPCLELPPLTVEESVQLLLQRAGSQVLHVPMMIHTDERDAMRDLAVALGGLPLALEQAAAYIEELHCSFSCFLQLFQQDALQILLERPSSLLYPYSVAKTFTLAFERLQQDNPAGADLLTVCCFLAPDEIPEQLLIQGKAHLGPELQAVLSDPFRLNTTFRDVLAYALLHRNTRDETLSVHRLVQIILKEMLSEADQRTWVERLVCMLDQLFLPEQDRLDASHWTWQKHLLPHAYVVLQLAEQWQLTSFEYASLLSKIAAYLFLRARYGQAEAFYQRAISLAEVHLEQGHLHNLAWLAYRQKRYAEAEAFIARALSFHEQASLPDQHIQASTLHLKANICRTQGRYAEAIRVYLQALHLYERVLEPGHIDIALLMSDFAKLYFCQAEWEKAAPLYREALHLWERFQELDHPDYADCLESYAELLRRQQEERGADLCIQRAREIRARHHTTSLAPLQEMELSVRSEASIDSMHPANHEEEDLFETFLQQRCVLSAHATCRAADLWQAYQTWVQTQGNAQPLSRQAFSFRLKMKNCSQARTNTHRIWCGIELIDS